MTIHKDEIERCVASNGDRIVTSRKVYLSYPTAVFTDDPNTEFEIRDKIAAFFEVGIHCVQFTGSAKTGWSFHSGKKFKKGESDLDAAIISSEKFLEYVRLISRITDGYTNLSQFGRTKTGISHSDLIKDGIARHSMVNLSLMPSGVEKAKIIQFFNRLTKEYNELFGDISVVIYASSHCFEDKQRLGFPKRRGTK